MKLTISAVVATTLVAAYLAQCAPIPSGRADQATAQLGVRSFAVNSIPQSGFAARTPSGLPFDQLDARGNVAGAVEKAIEEATHETHATTDAADQTLAHTADVAGVSTGSLIGQSSQKLKSAPSWRNFLEPGYEPEPWRSETFHNALGALKRYGTRFDSEPGVYISREGLTDAEKQAVIRAKKLLQHHAAKSPLSPFSPAASSQRAAVAQIHRSGTSNLPYAIRAALKLPPNRRFYLKAFSREEKLVYKAMQLRDRRLKRKSRAAQRPGETPSVAKPSVTTPVNQHSTSSVIMPATTSSNYPFVTEASHQAASLSTHSGSTSQSAVPSGSRDPPALPLKQIHSFDLNELWVDHD